MGELKERHIYFNSIGDIENYYHVSNFLNEIEKVIFNK